MSDLAIKAEGLSKLYKIGRTAGEYETLRDRIAQTVTSPFKKAYGLVRGQQTAAAGLSESIWALDDVSFEVKRGEVVGLIGRNGAGKSTLLKILSRITSPTKGEASIWGRVGSLLEVGTGFHPELTGRENIFLNGAILGMTRLEIVSKLDEIVAFAELEKFIDTPVKHYSSGMYMRLAFSVAAHLEPEILLVDEVLAVGDAAFQKKCLGKMEDVSHEGRTVLFVSHNMPAITRLCSRAVLLDDGKSIYEGDSADVVDKYLEGSVNGGVNQSWSEEDAPGTDGVKLLAARVVDKDGKPISSCEITEDFWVEMEYVSTLKDITARCMVIFNTRGVCAFATMEHEEYERKAGKLYKSSVKVNGNLLAEGEWNISLRLTHEAGYKKHYIGENDVLVLHVNDPMDGTSARGTYKGRLAGVFRPVLEWQ